MNYEIEIGNSEKSIIRYDVVAAAGRRMIGRARGNFFFILIEFCLLHVECDLPPVAGSTGSRVRIQYLQTTYRKWQTRISPLFKYINVFTRANYDVIC